MSKTIKTRIVKIGNSQGIRIPRTLLEQTGLSGEIEMEADKDRLILRPASARQGWELQFEQMAAAGGDRLLDGETSTLFDRDEWEW